MSKIIVSFLIEYTDLCTEMLAKTVSIGTLAWLRKTPEVHLHLMEGRWAALPNTSILGVQAWVEEGAVGTVADQEADQDAADEDQAQEDGESDRRRQMPYGADTIK